MFQSCARCPCCPAAALIRRFGGQALQLQYVSYTYTHPCKFSWSYEPQHPRYKHHRVLAPAMPTATLCHLAISFPGYPMVKISCPFCHNMLHTVPSNPTKSISNCFYYNHATVHHNHRCPPTCMPWMPRRFTMFLAKPLHESWSSLP